MKGFLPSRTRYFNMIYLVSKQTILVKILIHCSRNILTSSVSFPKIELCLWNFISGQGEEDWRQTFFGYHTITYVWALMFYHKGYIAFSFAVDIGHRISQINEVQAQITIMSQLVYHSCRKHWLKEFYNKP